MTGKTSNQRDKHDLPEHPLQRLSPLRVDGKRRSTFSNWPKSAAVSADVLCENGFYYMGIDDKVQCAFCGGILSGWSKQDDISREHARHFSKCERVVSNQTHSSNSNKCPVPIQMKGNCSTEMTSNISPYNIRFSLYSDRLSSFKTWPSRHSQKPEDLAATGLYYEGSEDKCQCYMCGGLLCNWEVDDVPKNEHKLWFSKCPLVKI